MASPPPSQQPRLKSPANSPVNNTPLSDSAAMPPPAHPPSHHGHGHAHGHGHTHGHGHGPARSQSVFVLSPKSAAQHQAAENSESYVPTSMYSTQYLLLTRVCVCVS